MQDVAGTWSDDFDMVQHLNEDASTVVDHFVDSTGNGYDGTLADTDGDSSSDVGIIGDGMGSGLMVMRM